MKLPNDKYSIENAIIMTHSINWSIFIDPQRQANNWIREKENISKLQLVNPRTPTHEFTIFLETALHEGLPMLYENF